MQAKASYNSPCGIKCVRPTPIRTDIPLLEDAGQHIIAIPGLLVDNIWAIAMPPWGSAGIQKDIRQSKDVQDVDDLLWKGSAMATKSTALKYSKACHHAKKK